MVKKSFRAWRSIANLKFPHKRNNGDTIISFQKKTNHPNGCSYGFERSTLAHATMPTPIYVHINGGTFDWVVKKGVGGTPLLETMAH